MDNSTQPGADNLDIKRADRLKTVLFSGQTGYTHQKQIPLDSDLTLKSLGRYLKGGNISVDGQQKISAIINRHFAEAAPKIIKWVFEGAGDGEDLVGDKKQVSDSVVTEVATSDSHTDSTQTLLAVNGQPLDAMHISLLRAYRWLPELERITFAGLIMSHESLSMAEPDRGFSGTLDRCALDKNERAMVLKMRAIRPTSAAILLINNLVLMAQDYRH